MVIGHGKTERKPAVDKYSTLQDRFLSSKVDKVLFFLVEICRTPQVLHHQTFRVIVVIEKWWRQKALLQPPQIFGFARQQFVFLSLPVQPCGCSLRSQLVW